MELESAQELSRVDHEPLFLVFLYLRKSYNTVYGERLISTLEGYDARPGLCGLMGNFWAHQKWCKDRMAFTYQPSPPHGEQNRAALYL